MIYDAQDKPVLNMEVLERMQTDEPIAVYIKAIVGKVGVIVFNPLTQRPEERVLEGDPRDSTKNRDDMTVKIYDEASHIFFKNLNRRSLMKGKIVPYKTEGINIDMTNAISDEQIDEILSQPFFTLMNRMNEFTSVVPVQRILIRAKELNKSFKTIQRIEAKLSEMQADQGLVNNEDKLSNHYKNLLPGE